FFMRLQVIVDNHSATTHDRHLSNFSGLEPATLNRGETLVPKHQRHVGYVFNVRRNVRVALTIHRQRKFIEDIQNYGYIVRSEIPGNVNIFLEKTKIQSPTVNITDISNIPCFYNFRDFADRGRIQEGMIDHQDKSFGSSDFDQFLAFSGRSRHRFFKKGMLT